MDFYRGRGKIVKVVAARSMLETSEHSSPLGYSSEVLLVLPRELETFVLKFISHVADKVAT